MKQNSYQTRRLLALRDMRHDGQNVSQGGEVFATETDARYLIRAGHARDPDEQVAPPPAPSAPTPPIGRRAPGRPSKADLAARSAAQTAAPPPPPLAPAGAAMTATDNLGSAMQGPGESETAPSGGEASAEGGASESGDRAAG